MNTEVKLAVLEEKVRELKEEIKEMKEWVRNNLKSLYEKANGKVNTPEKKAWLGSIFKIGS